MRPLALCCNTGTAIKLLMDISCVCHGQQGRMHFSPLLDILMALFLMPATAESATAATYVEVSPLSWQAWFSILACAGLLNCGENTLAYTFGGTAKPGSDDMPWLANIENIATTLTPAEYTDFFGHLLCGSCCRWSLHQIQCHLAASPDP